MTESRSPLRIFFLRSTDSPLADPDSFIIDSVRSEMLKRPEIHETIDATEADAIVINEPWAFREWRYIDKLLADPIIGRFPHKTYTINPDDAGAGLLRGLYFCLRKSRFDSRLHAAVPYLMRNESVLKSAGVNRTAPAYLATFRGNLASNEKLRGSIVRLAAKMPEVHAESSKSWLNHGPAERRLYVDLLRSGKFSLCPAGWGPATFRIYESMALGIAPVIIADEYVAPSGPDWGKFSLRVSENDIRSIPVLLKDNEYRCREMGNAAYEAWHTYFSPGRLFSHYCDELLNCMESVSSSDSAKPEVQRWRSPKMHWSNEWTMPQRFQNRVRRMMIGRPAA